MQNRGEKPESFQIWHFYWLFFAESMAVKGLMSNVHASDGIVLCSVCCATVAFYWTALCHIVVLMHY